MRALGQQRICGPLEIVIAEGTIKNANDSSKHQYENNHRIVNIYLD